MGTTLNFSLFYPYIPQLAKIREDTKKICKEFFGNTAYELEIDVLAVNDVDPTTGFDVAVHAYTK